MSRCPTRRSGDPTGWSEQDGAGIDAFTEEKFLFEPILLAAIIAVDLMAKPILPALALLACLLIIGSSGLTYAEEKPQQTSPDPGSLELHRRLADEFTNLDPGETGWQSESLSEAVTKKMKYVAKWLANPDELVPEKINGFITDGFTSRPLHYEELERLNDGRSMTISQAATESARADDDAAHRGVEGFATALRSLSSLFSGATGQRAKFKVMHVEIRSDTASTKLLFEMHGRKPESAGSR